MKRQHRKCLTTRVLGMIVSVRFIGALSPCAVRLGSVPGSVGFAVGYSRAISSAFMRRPRTDNPKRTHDFAAPESPTHQHDHYVDHRDGLHGVRAVGGASRSACFLVPL